MSLAAPPRPPTPQPSTSQQEPPERASGPRSRRPLFHGDDLPTFCLFLVTAAAAIGANRMFEGTDALPYLIGAAVAAHGLAWLGRRLGVPTGFSSLVSAVASLLLTVWFVVPSATTYGFPTLRTFHALSDLAQAGREAFATAAAPAAPTPGFIAACVAAIAFAAFLADWAAFRMRTAFEACVPAFALFILASVLGAAHGRAPATVGFLGAVGVFLLVQLATLEADRANWFAGRSTGATASLVVAGGAIVTAAALLALVVAPALPGYGAKPVIPTKHDNGGPTNRETVSPLVTIHSRLVNLSQQVVFSVQPTSPSYWRLTSLDHFDGDVWSITSETYSETKGRLGNGSGSVNPATGDVVDATFTIGQLDSIWLPVAYRPVQVSGVSNVSYNPNSGSLITAQSTSNGLSYTVRSVKPDPSAAQLGAASADESAGLQQYLQLPQIPQRVRALAAQIVAGARTPYEKALAIQNYFRANFKYSLTAEQGHSTSVLEHFLFDTKAGYCEQFAGSYGVLARLVGLPTRVAVGFRPGSVNPDGTYTVRDADAHAWPEVWFPGAGWVDFEPTPTVLSPTGSNHTGLPPAPVTPATTVAPSPTATTEGTAPSGTSAASTTIPDIQTGASPTSTPDNGVSSFARKIPLLGLALGSSRNVLFALVIILLALLILVLGLPAAGVAFVASLKRRRRDRRRALATTPEARIALAWQEAQESLAWSRLARRPAETLGEYLGRIGQPDGAAIGSGLAEESPGMTALGRLGAATAQAAYAPPTERADLAHQAEADRDQVLQALDAARTRSQRLKLLADPRPLLPDRPLAEWLPRVRPRKPDAPQEG